jgi:hypothetical protein
VGVEIVLHEYDLRDVGEVLVRQVFENLRVIDGGVAICDPGLRRGMTERVNDFDTTGFGI